MDTARHPTGDPVTTRQKAFQLNADKGFYGTIAEIGAGQEVARWFFRVGGAAGSVAKTMSAYDMEVSDAIYGDTERYVSRARLEAMLEHEYGLLLERLDEPRGGRSRFFVFADTVATCRHGTEGSGHGWLGVRFQVKPGDPPSEILIHAAMHDPERVREQGALGVVGINLIHGAAYLHETPIALVRALLENLAPGRVEVDMIRFSGPAFASVDNRLMSLILVEEGLTSATMFKADGEVVQPADELYRKPLLITRGRFRPVTKLSLDMLEGALAQMTRDFELEDEPPTVLMEMTLRDLRLDGDVDHHDFLARVDALRLLGQTVLISNHGPYYRLVEHLARFTDRPIGLAIGTPTFEAILDESYYGDLRGRLLEAVGRLFAHNVRVYLYPSRLPDGTLVDAESLVVWPVVRNLYKHLLESKAVVSIEACRLENLTISAADVIAKIAAGDASWKESVPPQIVDVIERDHLFGWS